jgi:hypothetical protein
MTTSQTLEVRIFHNGEAKVEDLAKNLREHLNGRFDVQAIDFSSMTGSVTVPPKLMESVRVYGDMCLPAIAIGDVVLKRGELLAVDEAAKMIEAGQPANDDVDLDLKLAAKASANGCCPAGTHCCA